MAVFFTYTCDICDTSLEYTDFEPDKFPLWKNMKSDENGKWFNTEKTKCDTCYIEITRQNNLTGHYLAKPAIGSYGNGNILQLESRIIELERIVAELYYAPPSLGGPGYIEALSDFTKRKRG